jgi:hypothetical protein
MAFVRLMTAVLILAAAWIIFTGWTEASRTTNTFSVLAFAGSLSLALGAIFGATLLVALTSIHDRLEELTQRPARPKAVSVAQPEPAEPPEPTGPWVS